MINLTVAILFREKDYRRILNYQKRLEAGSRLNVTSTRQKCKISRKPVLSIYIIPLTEAKLAS